MTPGRVLHSVAINLEPGQFLAGWQEGDGELFLPALSEARVGDEVAVRVGIFGKTIRATLFGKVSLVRRVGRPTLPPGAELAIATSSLPAARFLAAAARGEPVSYRERAPRYVVERRLLATREREELEVHTVNVSEGGCALSWTGAAPMVGEVVSLRLGDGIFASTVRAVVCWSAADGAAARALGLRAITEGRSARAWRAFATEAARGAARAA